MDGKKCAIKKRGPTPNGKCHEKCPLYFLGPFPEISVNQSIGAVSLFHYEQEKSDLKGGEDISQGEELMHQKKDDNQLQGRLGVPPAYFGP